MNKKYISIIIPLIIAVLVYVFQYTDIFKDSEQQTEEVKSSGLAEKIMPINIFQQTEEDQANQAKEEEILENVQETINPYEEIEDKANPFKSSYQNPFE